MSIPFFSIFKLFPHQLSRSRLKSGSGMSFSSLAAQQHTGCSAAHWLHCSTLAALQHTGCTTAHWLLRSANKERRREPARQPSSRQSAKIYSTKTNLGAQSGDATRNRSPKRSPDRRTPPAATKGKAGQPPAESKKNPAKAG